MKKKARILTALVLIMIMTFGMNLEASAVTDPINTIVERRADLPDIKDSLGHTCTSVQAMGVSRGENCLYSLKIKNNSEAILYYFPKISNWKNKAAFSIYNVGHANGMTVDTNYIYICAKPNGQDDNKIIRISRSYISEEAEGITTEEEITIATKVLSNTTDTNKYKIMQPKIINPNVAERSTTPYVNYDGVFSTITRAQSTGKFIIGKKIKNVTDDNCYNGFTRAEIIDDEFVVSSNPDDTFLVENNILYKDAAKQDIYYLEGYGLFIGRWMRKPNYDPDAEISDEENAMRNAGRSVILWANIDDKDSAGEYTYGSTTYRCYTPDRIRVYKDNHMELGVKKYDIFEIESMGITAKGNLIATFNVTYTSEYQQAYLKETGKNIDIQNVDGIYKITREDGKTFKLS